MARMSAANSGPFGSVYGSLPARGSSSDEVVGVQGRWPVVVAMVIAVSMPMLGNLGADAALQSIQRSLAARGPQMRWIIDAYLLGFSGLVLAGGYLADRFGGKRPFIWGAVLFILGSAAGGLAEAPTQLIWARGIMGVGAGLLVPATLSNTAEAFAGKSRGAAMGLWSAVSAIALLYGPVTGAYLVQRYSWSWIFFVNVPVVTVALILGAAVVKKSGYLDGGHRPDVLGAVLGSAASLLLAYALLEGNFRGWRDEVITGSVGLAAAFLILWLITETRRSRAMLPLRSFKNPAFSASQAVTAAVFFTLFGAGVLLGGYLRTVVGYSPGKAATLLLPFAGLLLLVSPFAGKRSDGRGGRGLMTFGSLLCAGGLGLLLSTSSSSSYETVVLPALILLGSGMGLIIGPMTTAAAASADARRQGLASGLTNTFRQVGVLVGIALLGTVINSSFNKALRINLAPAGLAAPVARSLVDSTRPDLAAVAGNLADLPQRMPPGTSTSVRNAVLLAARESFVDALHSGMLLSSGFMLLAAFISLIFVRSPVLSGAPGRDARPAPGRRQERHGEKGLATAAAPEVAMDPSPTLSHPAKLPAAPEAGVEEAGSPGSGSERQNRQPDAPPASGPHDHSPDELADLLFQMPFKAGSGTLLENLTGFIQATRSLHEKAHSKDAVSAALPEPVARSLRAATTPDIATLTGYLLLEQRFGRINPQVRPELAASALVGAAWSLSLWTFPDDQDGGPGNFLKDVVTLLIEGIGQRDLAAL